MDGYSIDDSWALWSSVFRSISIPVTPETWVKRDR
jgi:hypothetical protein